MAAEEASVSRAASRLNVSQPAVSRQIKDLEEELEVPLFDRTHNGLSLTEAGKTALTQAREILRQANLLTETMRRFRKDRELISIKVGFLPTALPGFLTNGMRAFNEAYKNVCVQIYEMTPSEQGEGLRKGDIDLALIGDPDTDIREEFSVETIIETEMAIVVPDNHTFAKRKTIDLSELGEEIFLTLDEKHFPSRPRIMASMFKKAKISPEVTIRASGLSELLGLVGGGAGVAMAPADLDQLPHSGVAFLRLKKPKLPLLFSAAWRKGDQNPGIAPLVSVLKKQNNGSR